MAPSWEQDGFRVLRTVRIYDGPWVLGCLLQEREGELPPALGPLVAFIPIL